MDTPAELPLAAVGSHHAVLRETRGGVNRARGLCGFNERRQGTVTQTGRASCLAAEGVSAKEAKGTAPALTWQAKVAFSVLLLLLLVVPMLLPDLGAPPSAILLLPLVVMLLLLGLAAMPSSAVPSVSSHREAATVCF
ncbi:hypothetical protein CLOM_g6126 [Closterium sp. NIES-68]|nr:hypothetical protein CLOM_g6126 [Closterium sp. NIES-68]GJP60862.1 hypothetical protein CLOP_g18077 [Closterium sp. NIES-67]GJP86747.1 hypothetical protein CLOP_g16733 [Closterium sp. NIES-67]